MLNQQRLECDTTDCTYWSEDGCTLPGVVTIQEHHCTDYEEKPAFTISIEVKGGVVQGVYAGPNAPAIAVKLYDMDDAAEGDDEVYARIKSELEQLAQTHREIY